MAAINNLNVEQRMQNKQMKNKTCAVFSQMYNILFLYGT